MVCSGTPSRAPSTLERVEGYKAVFAEKYPRSKWSMS